MGEGYCCAASSQYLPWKHDSLWLTMRVLRYASDSSAFVSYSFDSSATMRLLQKCWLVKTPFPMAENSSHVCLKLCLFRSIRAIRHSVAVLKTSEQEMNLPLLVFEMHFYQWVADSYVMQWVNWLCRRQRPWTFMYTDNVPMRGWVYGCPPVLYFCVDVWLQGFFNDIRCFQYYGLYLIVGYRWRNCLKNTAENS